jgi:hypothetical protein
MTEVALTLKRIGTSTGTTSSLTVAMPCSG